MFKDQSDVVVTKAQKRYEQLKKQELQKSTEKESRMTWEIAPITKSSASSWFSTLPNPPNCIMRPLAPRVEDQALAFFFSNYKIKPNIIPRGEFGFLPEMLNRDDTEQVLLSSVNAISLACLANNTKSVRLMKKARTEYGAALTMTNRALRSRDTVVTDSTIISVILLGMYESSVCDGLDSVEAMWKHVNGACALITLRGAKLFESEIGLQIVQQFYGNVLPLAVHTGAVLPEGVIQLWEKARMFKDQDGQKQEWFVASRTNFLLKKNTNFVKGCSLAKIFL
jgi:hypothetical protein